MDKEKWSDLVKHADPKTRVLAIISIIAEVLFIGALWKLPNEQTLYALIVCAVIFAISIIGAVVIEVQAKHATRTSSPVKPSALTPDTELLNQLVNGALQTVCRAVSIPETPESAKLRVFIFHKQNSQLVCSHYWAPNPVEEHVGQLRFDINAETAVRVAVVRAFINGQITRTAVKPLPPEMKEITGDVSDEVRCVLAAPIRNADRSIWGVVDFDAGNDKGRKLLFTEVSDAAMFQLAQHIQLIISFYPADIAA
jgi:hypothetical protein